MIPYGISGAGEESFDVPANLPRVASFAGELAVVLYGRQGDRMEPILILIRGAHGTG